jgi:signal transduction histidine kinase
MSLRKRLAVVLVLGLSALVVAVLAIADVLAKTDAARERTAAANAEAGAEALAERVDAPAFSDDAEPSARKQLRTTAVSVLRPLANSAGGYCTRTGAILVSAGKVGGDGGKLEGKRPLAPEIEEAVAGLCTRARVGRPVSGRVTRARDVNLLSAVAIEDRGAAWFLVRVRTHETDDTPTWPFEVVVLAVAAVALAAFTLDAIVALGRGAGELSRALLALEKDLRAPVPRPRARELAEIAEGLGSMATHLADARDRERALEVTLARDQRLAALGRVVAGVAHEVRNPLAGMKLRLDLLERSGRLEEAAREDVAACQGEVARLNRLVESLLTVSRPKTPVHEEIALGALADERIAQAKERADAAGVRIARAGDAATITDRDVLAAALDNLLRNAIEASPRGGTVHVRIEAGGERVTVDVVDQGSGIPDARRGELFEPFFTTKAEGTGLGLWISRLLLEAKGASLGYERVDGQTRLRIGIEPSRRASS